MFDGPYATLIKLGLLIGACIALATGWYMLKEHYRDQGRAEVNLLWHQAIVKQQEKEVQAAKEAEDFANHLEAKRNADFGKLAKRNKELEAKLASISLGPELTASVRESIRASNGEDARKPEENPPTATGLDYDNWAKTCALQYREAVDQIRAIVLWDDRRTQ